jgi:putative glutamine amidotransferase
VVSRIWHQASTQLRTLRGFLARRLPPATLKIGMSARLYHPPPDARGLRSKTMQYLEQSAAHWVMSRDVLVFMVPTVDREGLLHRDSIRVSDYARHLDGLVLQGGADVDPRNYGEEPLDAKWETDRMRDAYEMELLYEFIEARKPVLGLCRGLQIINVAFGGTLVQDIATQLPEAQAHVTEQYDRHGHEVRIEPGSGLARLYPGAERAQVTSIHHQAIKALGRNLVVEAWSEPDGLVEAVRGTGPGYVFAVQWHPEFHAPGARGLLDCTPILDEFLSAARDAS